ncbi:MAG: hypothetical protein GWO41_10300 [candidate division Zixibacteria bacterium]|nr:hypothetical protein [candidate division Zixibacteria bacterium]NIR64597.1 hypothetical protein [candidate division Zixibacteria bacterium]NIS16720.1 hypothetical protein [candidate division Zixibacteria bacterium]NIS46455.1 hypothetical protein [candidate division Zixibacteria bacterium]NIT53109.1 hypothetical protein [candidate division Zixibacteria bacterium]
MPDDTKNKAGLLERLQFIDRRYIFIFIALAVIIPLLLGLRFEEEPSPIVLALYDKIDDLPPGSRLLMSFDYGPTTAPEIQPMVDVILRHACLKGLKVYLMAVWATGQSLTVQTVEQVLEPEFPNYEYGIDYVNLGYKAGNQGLIRVIVDDMKRMYSTDANGTDIEEIPIMKQVASLKDMDLIVSFGGGFPGIKEWILFAGDPGQIPIGGACTAVSAPQLYPYYPNQMVGLLGGIKGAAEYESHVLNTYPDAFAKTPTPGMNMMVAQMVAHIVIMLFIVFGNVMYFMYRGKERKLTLEK